MKKIILIFLFNLLIFTNSYAKHQYEEYSFDAFWKYEIKGSNDYYKFNSDLIEDKDVKKELKNKKKTRLVSYLLFEDNKIKIDEHDLPSYIKNNKGSYYSVTSEDFEGSELRVYFDNSLKVLKGWDIIENEKISIKLNILEIRKLENLNNFDKNIFKFSESMRANLRGFLGPYKRKLKRLPTSNTNLNSCYNNI